MFMPNKRILEVSCGSTHTMAIDSQYSLYGWGTGSSGELGFFDLRGRGIPSLITTIAERAVLKYFKL